MARQDTNYFWRLSYHVASWHNIDEIPNLRSFQSNFGFQGKRRVLWDQLNDTPQSILCTTLFRAINLNRAILTSYPLIVYSINTEISKGFSHSSIFIGVFLASVIYSLNEICIRYSIHLTSSLHRSDIISFKISLSPFFHFFFFLRSLHSRQSEFRRENMLLSLSLSLINLVFCKRFYSENYPHYIAQPHFLYLPSISFVRQKTERKTNSCKKRLSLIIQI